MTLGGPFQLYMKLLNFTKETVKAINTVNVLSDRDLGKKQSHFIG